MKIQYRIALDTIDCDESNAADMTRARGYAAEVATKISAEYPDADVDVDLNSDFCNASQCLISDNADGLDEDDVRENVFNIANHAWERGDFGVRARA